MSAENKSRYEKPEDLIWDTYLKAAKGEDEARPKNWEGSTTGILTFVSSCYLCENDHDHDRLRRKVMTHAGA